MALDIEGIIQKLNLKWYRDMEDHTGIPFDGLNQYRFSDGKVKTFSKEELRELLIESVGGRTVNEVQSR